MTDPPGPNPSPDRVFAEHWEHVRAHPHDLAAWDAFASLLARARFVEEADPGPLLDALLACLAQERLDPQPLADATLRLFRRERALGPLLAAADEDDPERLHATVAALDATALDRNVVALALARLILPSMAAERAFRAVRRALLLGDLQVPGTRLTTALARQCFRNGYVWVYEEVEAAALEALATTLASRPLDTADMPAVALLGCYAPLWTWERAPDVLGLAHAAGDPWFSGLVRQQVEEPTREHTLRDTIPLLSLSDDPVSAEVRAQYEEHPYPRWTAVHARSFDTVSGALEAALGRRVPYGGDEENPRILVAGCGTGRQLAQVAQRFPGADVVGLDLSLASLAYAKRRLEESGLDRVALFQADLLALDGWEERFDIVECGGVLHHLADPVRGWRVLTALLRPGGVMRIALYSTLARREVATVRRILEEEDIPATADAIRQCRPIVAEAFRDSAGGLLRWVDFYSMEECRDLLFHAQEHTFTLPEIRDILGELGLAFLGFELPDPTVARDFAHRDPGERGTDALDAWHRFEVEFPDTFRGMYQFWVGVA